MAASVAHDRGESQGLMEPLQLGAASSFRTELTDLAVTLVGRAAGFRRSLPAGLLRGLGDLVRAMSCYYSNLIEGHETHPIEIERALKKDYSANPRQRDLQIEAEAHIAVQRWIDEGGLRREATAGESLLELHRRFYERLPESMLWVEDPETKEPVEVTPGAWRERDVSVGRHVPVSPGAVPRFLDRFEAAYEDLGATDRILAVAAAHHRLVWIHPFLDGNGRVARLMSHAMLLDALDTGGVWSIARGLARQVNEYRQHLAACDLPRRNDLDGRGHLSEEALAGFTRFFLTCCIDQVDFMERLMAPDRLRARILMWTEEEVRVGALPNRAGAVMQTVLDRGELPRGEVAGLLGTSGRQARRVTSALIEREVLKADSVRAPLRLGLPARLASRWLPGLFP